MADRVLIIMWDDNGLESISDISAFEEESEARVFAILAGDEPPDDSVPILDAMRLRSLYNMHRNYQIYGIKLSAEFTDDIIIESLSPSSNSRLKYLIQSKGVKIS